MYYVYILSNEFNTTFYVGVTKDLVRRVCEHKQKIVSGFTKKYNIDKLVYYEEHAEIKNAITREKNLKNWHRDWKINLIREKNELFEDLYDSII